MQYNFDFATAHSTGFFKKKKFMMKLDYMIQILNVLQIMICISEFTKKLKGSFT